MTKGKAYIFINEEQAAGFGHIGWGFQLAGDHYYFGSTDHLWRTQYPVWHPIELIRYMDVRAADNNDFWAAGGTFEEMMRAMRAGPHVRYHQYKELTVDSPNPLVARARADSMRDNGWNILLNNCVHQSYQIITTYGAELPCPYKVAHRFPKSWFKVIDAKPVTLEPSRGRMILATLAVGRRKAG